MTARKPLKINGFPVITLGKKPGEGVCQAGTRFAKFFAVVFTCFLAGRGHHEYVNQAVSRCFLRGEDNKFYAPR